jgi:hypothetical protein
MNKIVQVFLGADLRNSHDGLTALAKSKKIDVTKLEPGQFVLFINHSRDRLKLFAANNVIAYLKVPSGRLNMATISLIPQAFHTTGKIEYDKVLREVLIRELERKSL